MVFGMKIQMRHFWPFSNSVHLVTEDKLTSPVVHDFALKVFFGIKCPTTRIDFVSGSFLGKLVHGKLRLVTINGKIVMTCKDKTKVVSAMILKSIHATSLRFRYSSTKLNSLNQTVLSLSTAQIVSWLLSICKKGWKVQAF